MTVCGLLIFHLSLYCHLLSLFPFASDGWLGGSEKVTFSREKMTFSDEKVTFTTLKMTFSDEKVTFTNEKVTFLNENCKET